jgi:hypothetical protein
VNKSRHLLCGLANLEISKCIIIVTSLILSIFFRQLNIRKNGASPLKAKTSEANGFAESRPNQRDQIGGNFDFWEKHFHKLLNSFGTTLFRLT